MWTRDGAQSRWVLTREPGRDGLGGDDAYPQWPQEPNEWVLGRHHYAGPYVVRPPEPSDTQCTGDFHGNVWTGQHGWMDDDGQKAIVAEGQRAIRGAELFFAYINEPD